MKRSWPGKAGRYGLANDPLAATIPLDRSCCPSAVTITNSRPPWRTVTTRVPVQISTPSMAA